MKSQEILDGMERHYAAHPSYSESWQMRINEPIDDSAKPNSKS